MTLITVAIPTYRRDMYLKQALDSVLGQTLTDIEIIVSDNANSAATRELVGAYRDPRISYAPLDQNIGLHRNLTRCLRLGSAPFVAVLLDDDIMYPANLQAKLDLLHQHPTAGLVHGAFNFIDRDGNVSRGNITWTGDLHPSSFETGRQFIERVMALGNRICASSALIRRPAVAKFHHEERDGSFSDLAIWLRMATTWDVAFINLPLTGFRIHDESASSEVGLYELQGDQINTSTFRMTGEARLAKLRFIDEYDTNILDRLRLRHRVRDRARTELKGIVADETLPSKKIQLTARHLFQAARVEPSLWWSPWSAVLLASSVFGRQFFDRTVDLRTKS